MNIWIFNHYAVGPDSPGITRHYDLAKELVKKDIDVTIITSSFNYQVRKEQRQYKRNEWYQIELIDGIRFVWLKTSQYERNNYKRLLNMLDYSLKAFLLKRILKDKPTHVIGSLMHPFAAITAAKVAKKKNATFIFEERDLWPQSMIDLGKVSSSSLKVKILRKIEKRLIDSSDKILLLFDKAKVYMRNKGVPEEKMMVISNGVDLNKYKERNTSEMPREVQKVLEENNGKFTVVYTGAHGMANNLDMVLDAAKILLADNVDDIQFIFLGDGVHKKSLMERKENEQIHNVTLLDSIDKEYIPGFLNQTDIGILPLHDSPVFNWGISPNKMYDYMAAKLPVIILTDIENDALHEKNPSIIIPKDQSKNLVITLQTLKNDRKRTKQLGDEGYQFIESYCNWEVLANDFVNQLK